MIEADIKCKLQNPEDVLTSNVFGLLNLLPDKYLCKIFNTVLPNDKKVSEDIFVIEEFELWKCLDGKVPDVYLKLKNGMEIVVEVKYGSPESDENQLKNYLDRLQNVDKFLIYLTADRTEPIYVTMKEIYKSLPIYWISWYKLNEIIKHLKQDGLPPVEYKILDLIHRYLNFKQFVYFSGWSSLKYITKVKFYEGEQNG